jgi:5-methyltetrahydropteroyltriglutamate--homocysteine methyltransferase
MDSDVISTEASRSKGEIIEKIKEIHYDHGIGLGVYDIHSPRTPIVERSIKVIEKSYFG